MERHSAQLLTLRCHPAGLTTIWCSQLNYVSDDSVGMETRVPARVRCDSAAGTSDRDAAGQRARDQLAARVVAVFQHPSATIALDAGVDIKVVSEQLGHSTTTLTRDTYQSVTKQMHQDAAGSRPAGIGGRAHKSAADLAT